MQKAIIITFLLLSPFWAKEPKLEIGLGIATIGYPNYIGADSRQTLVSPFPYIRYRGESFQIEKGGIKRELFEIDGLSVDLSLGGSLPSDSDEAKARDGMLDLDLTFELGPKITYALYEDEKSDISFRLPLRAVFSTDFQGVDSQGYLTSPKVRFEYRPNSKMEMSFSTGPVYAGGGYHDYFYSVDKAFETERREVYDAKDGYSGYRNALGLKYRYKKWWVGAFASHFALSGARYEDSPLVEQKSALFLGTSFAYIFYSE